MSCCSVVSCEGKAVAKGLCGKHYQRMKKYGDPLKKISLKGDSWRGVGGEMSHTPEPWKFTPSIPEEGFECFWIESDDEFRNQIADVRGPQNEENTANARRIVACVNWCKGNSTEGMERAVEIGRPYAVERDAAYGRELDLTKQRDELLAAMERIKGLPEKHPQDAIACVNQTNLIA